MRPVRHEYVYPTFISSETIEPSAARYFPRDSIKSRDVRGDSPACARSTRADSRPDTIDVQDVNRFCNLLGLVSCRAASRDLICDFSAVRRECA